MATIPPEDCPGVRKVGHLKRLKTLKRKLFVLRDGTEGVARLEYYDSEKKFRSGVCKRPVELRSCLTINEKYDSKANHVIGLYTKEECFGIVCESELEQNEWLTALLELSGEDSCAQPKLCFEHVWQVDLTGKGLGRIRELSPGPYRLCLTNRTLGLMKVSTAVASVELQLEWIPRIGHSDVFFFMQVGRSAPIGSGELWMKADDKLIAQNMHETILNSMKQFRPRSSSSGTQPITVPRMQGRGHSPGVAGSSRNSANFPKRSNTFSTASPPRRRTLPPNSRSPSLIQQNSNSFGSDLFRARTDSMESGCSRGTIDSMPEVDEFESFQHEHSSIGSRTPDQSFSSTSYLDMTPGGSTKRLASQESNEDATSGYIEMAPTHIPPPPPSQYLLQQPQPSDAYIDMYPGDFSSSPSVSSASSLSHDTEVEGAGYTDMTAQSNLLPTVKEGGSNSSGYVAMSPGCAHTQNKPRPEVVRSYLTDDTNVDEAPKRCYSVGSKPQHKNMKADTGYVDMAVNAHHGTKLSRSSSGKSSSAPHLPDSRSARSHSSRGHDGALMELSYRYDAFRNRTSSQGKHQDIRHRTSSSGRESSNRESSNRESSNRDRGAVIRADSVGQHDPAAAHSYHRNRTATISQDTRTRTGSMSVPEPMRQRSHSYGQRPTNANTFLTSQESLRRTVVRNSAESLRNAGVSSFEQLDKVLQDPSLLNLSNKDHASKGSSTGTSDYLPMNHSGSKSPSGTTDTSASPVGHSPLGHPSHQPEGAYMDLSPGKLPTHPHPTSHVHPSPLTAVSEVDRVSISPPSTSHNEPLCARSSVTSKNSKSPQVRLPSTTNTLGSNLASTSLSSAQHMQPRSGTSDYVDLSLTTRPAGARTTPESTSSQSSHAGARDSPTIVIASKTTPVTSASAEEVDSYSVFQPGTITPSRQSSVPRDPLIHTSSRDNHTPSRHSHTPSRDSHTPSRDSHTPSRDSHTPSRDSHTHSRYSHTPSRDSHTPSRDSHTPSRDSHTPSRDSHSFSSPSMSPSARVSASPSLSTRVQKDGSSPRNQRSPKEVTWTANMNEEEDAYTEMNYGGKAAEQQKAFSKEGCTSGKSKLSPTSSAVQNLSNKLAHVTLNHRKNSSGSSETNSTSSSKDDLTLTPTGASRSRSPIISEGDVNDITEPFPGLMGDMNLLDPTLTNATSQHAPVNSMQNDLETITQNVGSRSGGARPKSSNKSISIKSKKKKASRGDKTKSRHSSTGSTTSVGSTGRPRLTDTVSAINSNSLLDGGGPQSICSSYAPRPEGPAEYVECENRLSTSMAALSSGSLNSTTNGTTTTLHHHHRSRSPSPKFKPSQPQLFDLAVVESESDTPPTRQSVSPTPEFAPLSELLNTDMKKGSLSAMDVRTVGEKLPRQSSHGSIPQLNYASLNMPERVLDDTTCPSTQSRTAAKKRHNSTDDENVEEVRVCQYAQIDFAKSESLKQTTAIREKQKAQPT